MRLDNLWQQYQMYGGALFRVVRDKDVRLGVLYEEEFFMGIRMKDNIYEFIDEQINKRIVHISTKDHPRFNISSSLIRNKSVQVATKVKRC
jgi:hypothetical protein